MDPSLQQAIEGVYSAFRDIRKPPSVSGCPCCIEQKEIGILLTKPLRDLSPDDLKNYAFRALVTVGKVDDYLYFLPRILEILVTEPDWWPSPEVVTRGIHTAGFHTWPESRRQTLERYFDEVVSELLGRKNSGREIDSWICALGRLHANLAPFLARIAANGPRLIEFFEANSEAMLAHGRLGSGFWEDAPDEHRQVLEWFRSPEIQKIIWEQYELAWKPV